MTKRYQIFISSTYLDLLEERQAVLKAVLELEHIPSGMELFPATDDAAWDLIKTVIAESDYYVLIIGGKYGSVHPDGLGFTEMEYDFAIEQKKPVIALLHRSPDQIPRDKTDVDAGQWKKLEKFREKVSSRHTCQFWTNAHDLKAGVITSLTANFRRHPAIGWVRADTIPSGARIEDVLLLKERVAQLEGELIAIRTTPATGSEGLQQGEDEHEMPLNISTPRADYEGYAVAFTWDDLFSNVAPVLLNEAPDRVLRNALKNYIESEAARIFLADEEVPKQDRSEAIPRLQSVEIDTCIVQFRALGLIIESRKRRSVTDSGAYWALTPYGDQKLVQLRAIRKIT